MARIELSNLAHQYTPGAEYALQSMDHVWEDGGAYALLGPSGCGKTTLLNIISGLVQPSEGRVLFDGRDVTALPPERRNIGQVFQFPVIYDTMSVYDNLAFPLRNRGIAADAVDKRVRQVADMLSLEHVIGRRAEGLTADAKQKISLGRGLVREDVAAVLFDEPLTVIDPHLKWQLRRKLREVHEQLRLTLVYVTHDQTEAMTFADQVVVMYAGRVVQMGSPEALFERPAHTFVGYFIGSPGMNFLDCALDGDAAVVDGHRIPLDPERRAAAERASGHLQLGIRPEYLRPARDGEPGLAARVEQVEDLGDFKLVTARLGERALHLRVAESEAIGSDGIELVFPTEQTLLYADEHLVA
ncbi:ABC transporter ATP-binding protein [Spiribacter halobius]|uniref:ABC transporter ATP-binding protein n=1 Tax=Sediminicurvatus halobius TaxID=2182432 RepID=A0A2U2N006_9GAMM|nr:ABC transporter ATP-binding protein [Spiribacter halobius]PWG62581.1 ABC transporter ATP-binding protein [Spiribacter halobius]UEX78503.1 ABC transporter ATP-binding protein [Spiribacter halobius]